MGSTLSGLAYTKSWQARAILAERASRRAEVEDWWRENEWKTPSLPPGEAALAVMARQVPTFRYEDGAFVLLAERAGLDPSWFALSSDVYSDESPYKKSLIAPQFCTGQGPDGTPATVDIPVSVAGRTPTSDTPLAAIRVRQAR